MRVALRLLEPADSATLFAWRNSPDVRAYMYTDHEIGAAEHAAWFERAVVDPARRYWIIQVDGVGVGLANLVDIDPAAGAAAWAYYIADPAQRGKGVGAMAEFRVLDEVFGTFGLSTLRCEVLETNTAVIKLHRRFGFSDERRLPGRAVKDGRPVDAVGLALTAEDWARARPGMAERLAKMGFEL